MLRKYWIVTVVSAALMIVSCGKTNQGSNLEENKNELETDSLEEEEVSEQDEILKEVSESKHLDEVFSDFLFTFIHSKALQRQRIQFPITRILSDGTEQKIERKEWNDDFEFLKGDYFTTIFTSANQLSYANDTILNNVCVERLDMNDQKALSYDFTKNEGRWELLSVREIDFADSDLSDFLAFYSRWSTDSVFQSECIAKSLKITMLDPDDEDQTLEGMIDREQFRSFCPDVPAETISNIRYGQNYSGANRILLQKSGLSNGLQEIFTFEKDHRGWKLKAYEN